MQDVSDLCYAPLLAYNFSPVPMTRSLMPGCRGHNAQIPWEAHRHSPPPLPLGLTGVAEVYT